MITAKGVNVAGDETDFQDSIDAMTGKRRTQDYDDLQNELAGRDTGRNARFLGKGNAEAEAVRRRNASDQIQMSALQALLQNDPDYAARYNDVMDLLIRAEAVTEQALQDAQQDLGEGQDALDDMRGNANRLPDGTAIYRDANGDVWTEDGRQIEGEELDSIVWKDGAPSYEDVLKQKESVEAARQRIEELRRYQIDVLGKHRNRMTDPDNPPSREDMDEIEKDILRHPDPVAQSKLEPQEIPPINTERETTPPAKPPI